jgi:hypothetical protein
VYCSRTWEMGGSYVVALVVVAKQTLSVAEGSQPNPHPRDIMQFAFSGGP